MCVYVDVCVFAPFYGTAGSLYMFLNDLIVWLAVCTCFYVILWCGWQFVRVFIQVHGIAGSLHVFFHGAMVRLAAIL